MLRFKYILLFLFACVKIGVNAQESAFESFEVVFEKPFYLTGETIHFSVWFTDKTVKKQSKVVRFDLINDKGEIVARKKIARQHNKAHGAYFIPVEWATGFYTCRFYTLNNLNFLEKNYSDFILPIYTSLSPPENISIPTKVTKDVGSTGKKSIFQLTKTDFQRTEKIEIALDFNREDSIVYDVLVLDKDWLSPDFTQKMQQQEKTYSSEKVYPLEDKLSYELELKKPDNGQNLNSDFILLSHPGEYNFQKVAAREGKVVFQSEDFKGQKEIQVHNLNPYLPFLPKVNEIWPDLPTENIAKLPLPDSTILRYYEMTKKVRKLQELYPDVLPIKQQEDEPTKSKKAKPNRTYDVTTYMDLINLEEFVENVVFGGHLKEREEKQTVRLVNEDNHSEYVNAPVYFVNGYLSGNEAEILNIPLSQLQTVDIFNTKESILSGFPSFMLGMGVISVTTKKNTVPKSISNTFNSLMLSGVAEDGKSNNLLQAVDKIKPIFRPVVYRANNLQTDANGQAKFSFYSTSSIGVYRILVFYQDVNGNLQSEEIEVEIK